MFKKDGVCSEMRLAQLSTLGSGLLVGAALGVVIPEGIENSVSAVSQAEISTTEIPTFRISLFVLLGFSLMLLVEQRLSPHDSDTHHTAVFSVDQDGDVNPEELELEVGPARAGQRLPRRSSSQATSYIPSTNPVSLGLLIHSLVDGYALGVTALNPNSLRLSLIVFLAIMVHKAPTALALTSTLLASSMPVSECKRHLALFSIATPLGAILSYAFYSFFAPLDDRVSVGSPLLFSGGTFLYVSTMLTSASGNVPSFSEDMSKATRTVLLLTGMFFPPLVSSVLGHGH